MKVKKILRLAVYSCLFIIFLTGCATVPRKKEPTAYNIGGVAYISLLSLCGLEGITWEYDTFTKTVNLSKGPHRINLMIGDTLVLIDGLQQRLRYPVDIYQGTVVVPYKFKEQILDPLFREKYLDYKTVLATARIKRIVIDPGHGGNDPGTIGKSGLREKDVNLDIAKRLAVLLRADGIEVVRTRSTDAFIPLARRVAIANNSKSDLFISIHSNANRVRSLSGFEVYYITPNANDSKRALYCAENAKLDIDMASFAYTPTLNLKAILWDMIYTSNRAESIKLARSICHSTGDNLDTKILGIKGASFYVLKGTYMPAVLIEVGFLSNYNEELLIRNGYYRQQIAESIEQGIKNYIRGFTLFEFAKQ